MDENRLLLGIPAREYRITAEHDCEFTTLMNIRAFQNEARRYKAQNRFQEYRECAEIVLILQLVLA